MSEIIGHFTSRKGRPPKYPWMAKDAEFLGKDEYWADGQARKLFKGEDFDGTLTSMRTMVHRTARLLGLNARTHINEADQSIEVEFYVKD